VLHKNELRHTLTTLCEDLYVWLRLPCSVVNFACKSKILQAADASIIATTSVHHFRFDQMNLNPSKLLHTTIRRHAACYTYLENMTESYPDTWDL